VRYSHPDWLVTAIRSDWPEAWTDVLAANNRRAPMHLRVNARRSARSDYLHTLAAAGLAAAPIDGCPDGITLDAPQPVQTLPGFAEGQVSVQDGAAQLAADLLDLRAGQRVLDACAAPGNKSAHALERRAVELLSLDIDADRLATLAANLARLGLQAQARVADAAEPSAWWDGRPFDRILLDAPCSGTGVIRRHPDIKWLRRPADVQAAEQRQRRLLRNLWPTLATGGRLVYATCSVLRAEGVDVIGSFLAEQRDAREQAITATWGKPEVYGRRITPDAHGFDGFYYAVLERKD
jgi:16S rRNA (cytosine967-C5)-methyltransferase